MKLKRLYKALTHPSDVVEYLVQKTCLPDKMSDESYLKLIYWIKFHKKLNLDNPVTFNEKLQWLKLHDHNPLYPKLVDKITVKDYVASIIGNEYIIPTLKVYNSIDDIKIEDLPDQFVLKTNHSGGNAGVVICHDKSTFNLDAAKKKLQFSLESNMFSHSREWPYSQIKPQVFAEQFISENGELSPEDYKVHNFNGVPKVILVCRDRFRDSGLTSDFYSDKWEHLDIRRPLHKNASQPLQRPAELEEMLELSSKLSKKIPFVRTDFYTIKNQIYFGELTFYPASGFQKFEPEQWDKELGDWLIIPTGGGKLLIRNNIHILLSESENHKSGVNDYKFFCFDGEVKTLFVGTERNTGDVKFDFYDANFNHLDLIQTHPMSGHHISKPLNFEMMKVIAGKLSTGFPHVRVDLYNIEGKIYFGELTFYHHGGFYPFHPESWDYEFGSWLKLPFNHFENEK